MSQFYGTIATPASNPQFTTVLPRQLPPEKPTQRPTSHPALSPVTNAFIAGAAAVPARVSVNFLSVLRASAQGGVIGHRIGPCWGTYYILKQDGLRALFKGIGVAGVKSFPLYAGQFAIYDALSKRYVPKVENNKPSVMVSMAIWICGGVAGSTVQAVLHPLDLVKTRLIMQDLSRPPIYANSLDCLRQILAKDSILGLYRGFVASVAGAGVFGAYMFSLWDFYNRLPWARNENPLQRFEFYLYPVFAVTIAGVISSPLDVVRRKMMAFDAALPHNGRVEVEAATLRGTATNVFREHGLPGFLRGQLATMAKSGPQLLVFWLALNALQRSALALSNSPADRK